MPTPSFRVRLHQAVVALMVVIAIAVAFSFFSAQQIDRAALRSRNAQAVLVAHVTLSNNAYNLFKQMSDAALFSEMADSEWDNMMLETVRADIRTTRRLIADEVGEQGASDDEKEELDRLAIIERQVEAIVSEYASISAAWAPAQSNKSRREMARLLDERIDRDFTMLIDAAIDDERREVADADARLRRISGRIRAVALAIFALAAPLAAFVLFYLNRTLLKSLRSLTDGAEAYARGEYEHAIPELPSREFEVIGQRFVRMASELAASRQTLSAANQSLERQVSERTTELAEANRRLEENDATRRQFFADVSHELRTPLTVIRGEAEIALRGPEKSIADYRESLSRIVEHTGETTRLVDDLLFIARADAGEPRIEMRTVAVTALLAEVVTGFEPLAKKALIKIEWTENDDGAVVIGDRGRLRQVLGVLLDNAIRYSREGGVVRILSMTDARSAVIRIIDDGIGIPDNEAERVFDRFYRADNARAHAGGAGLGLPVAKAIIEAHNGHIRLSASPGGGVEACVTLPVETKLRAIS